MSAHGGGAAAGAAGVQKDRPRETHGADFPGGLSGHRLPGGLHLHVGAAWPGGDRPRCGRYPHVMQGYTGLYSIDERQTGGVCFVIPPCITANVSSMLLNGKGYPEALPVNHSLFKLTHSAKPGL